MAMRKPLVIVGGQIEQLQTGDTIDVTGDLGIDLTNDNVGTLDQGTPVYVTAADHCDKAKADATGTRRVIGLVGANTIGTGVSGFVQTTDIITLTTGQWDAVCGTSGGLSADTVYYLSAATAGLLTATAPSTVGQYVVPVILAISTTEALILHEQDILL